MLPIERRIPDNLGGTDTILDDAPIVGTVEFSDGIIAFGPAMLTLFVLNNILPPSLGIISLIASGIVGFIGVLFLVVKPEYLSLSEWLQNYREFRNRPAEITKRIATDGGMDHHGVPITSNPDTREYTQVNKIYPHVGAIHRTDGKMVGAVECGGLNLDTSTGEEWQLYSDKLANWFNTQVTYDVQFYMPMRQFDPTDQMNMYLDRLEDDESSQNFILSEYLQDRAAWMQATANQSFIRNFYVLFEVSRSDVLTDEFNQGDFQRNLKNMPGGDSMEAFVKGIRGEDTASTLSDNEVIERQLREIERRRSEIMQGLGLGGENKTTAVDGDKLGVILKEFWEGTTVREDEAQNFVRKKPVVTGSDSTIADD